MTSSKKGGKDERGELPRLIKQAGKAVDEDFKPTLHVLGKLFFGAWADNRVASSPSQPEQPEGAVAGRAKKLPPVRVRMTTRKIPDAEIVQEEGLATQNFTICPTCGGSGRLGRPGYEVRCPYCNP